MKLEIPYLSGLETVYTSPIADDGTFCFRFSPYASTREVALRNYAEHLYVHPGDSLHVEMTQRFVASPCITGTSSAAESVYGSFTEGGYYLQT